MAEQSNVAYAFDVVLDIGDSRLECVVALDITLASPDAMAAATRVVELFEQATAAGMFSESPSTQRTPIEILERDVAGAGQLRRVWKLAPAQEGTFRVLLNMLSGLHKITGAVNAVRLVSPPGPGDRLKFSDVAFAPYPVRAVPLPFTFRPLTSLEVAREPLIRCQFARPITDADVQRIAPLFQAWDCLVGSGGYLDDDSEEPQDLEEIKASQQTYLATPDTVEHLFYFFIGEQASFEALLNLVARIHTFLGPIESLEIE